MQGLFILPHWYTTLKDWTDIQRQMWFVSSNKEWRSGFGKNQTLWTGKQANWAQQHSNYRDLHLWEQCYSMSYTPSRAVWWKLPVLMIKSFFFPTSCIILWIRKSPSTLNLLFSPVINASACFFYYICCHEYLA